MMGNLLLLLLDLGSVVDYFVAVRNFHLLSIKDQRISVQVCNHLIILVLEVLKILLPIKHSVF